MLFNLSSLCTAAAILGPLSHRLYWIRYEFDAKVPKILLAAKLTFIVLTFALSRSLNVRVSLQIATLLVAIYATSLFLSIATYRLYYHPLRRYQGPFWARLTTWWKVKHIAQNGPHYALTDRLHAQYGDVIRLGPNNVSVNNVEALQAIYGSQSSCTKPPSYLIGGLVSVQSERDPHRHRLRRAVWDKALGTNASNVFYPRLAQMVDLMIDRLEACEGQSVSVNDWIHFVTFDVMAQFCFSRDWNQLMSGKMHEGIKYASEYLKFAVFGTQVPWLAITLMKIPFMPEPQSAMVEFSSKALDLRIEQEPPIPDAMSYVLREKDPAAQQFLTRHDLESDVFMIMLAGADTSFSTLVNLSYKLATHPQYQDQLRAEVSAAFKTGKNDNTSVDWHELSSSTFLTALIHETLRLHPPVPSGMPRVAPPEGLHIPLGPDATPQETFGDESFLHIPGKAVISVPTYTIQRSARYWVQPNEFIPERWTTKPELILDKRAWCPFSLGTYGCAGKYFALMEIKLIMARLVMAFEIRLAQDMNQQEKDVWLASQDDHMTLQPSELKLKFVKR